MQFWPAFLGAIGLKEKISSRRSKFLPSRVDPFWKGYIVHGTIQVVTKVVSLVKIGTKHGVPLNRKRYFGA